MFLKNVFYPNAIMQLCQKCISAYILYTDINVCRNDLEQQSSTFN